MDRGSPPPHERRPLVAELALGTWLAGLLVLARGSVVLGLELAHNGDARLAGLRLASGFATLVLVASALAAAAVLGARAARARGARVLLALALAGALLLFLTGRFGGDRSLRIGGETLLGQAALAAAALGALGLAAAFAFSGARLARLRLAHSWVAIVLPLAGLAAAALVLRGSFQGFGATMDVRSVEVELVNATWETLRAQSEAPPAAGVLAPASEFRADGAARPTLLLAPPARVRTLLPPFEGQRWVVGGAGIDQAATAELAQRFPGQAVRFRVRVDGAEVSVATLTLAGDPRWHELGGAGLPVHGGAQLELETALIDADGREVAAGAPLRVGFGGLALQRRERLARTGAAPARPNLVLVVLDTLRADRTSAYGYARPTTPNLAALAARGVLFEEVCATASWTWPSTASLLTGLYPEQHGVQDATSSFLAASLDTLPEALQRAGFTTAAWSGSPLIVPDKGFDQGFEFFDASREGRLRRSDLLLPAALEWLGTLGGTRFFLYLHLMEPHAPFVPLAEGRAQFAAEVPAGYDPRKVLDYNWELQSAGFDEHGVRRTEAVVTPEEQRWISDLYDGCVWSGDHYLGLLFARLEELGLTDDTIVAVTSDHGEELFEHGLVTHGNTLHRELVRVPLVLAGPGLPRGERVATPLSGVALGPTLARLGGAALAGLTEPPDLFVAPGAATMLFSTRQGWWNGYARQPLFGLREGSAVLHFAPEAAPWGATERPGAGELRLYDLARDPGETTDLARSEPERAQALRKELLKRLTALAAQRVLSGAAPDPATLERLRGLGYVGK